MYCRHRPPVAGDWIQYVRCEDSAKTEGLRRTTKIFIRTVEASEGIGAGADDRILDAEGLALKFFGHASAAFHLYQGTVLPHLGTNFIDVSSINVLGRAALETFLVFHHVFVSPTSEEEKDFRYISWKLAGLLERQTLPAQSPKGKAMLLEEAQLIAPLQGKLSANQHFKALKPGQQKELLKKGKWRLPPWKKMALTAGLSCTHAETFYSYLCEYAHAGNLSVLQIRDAQTAQSQRTLCAATIGVLIISMANMIKSYCTVFPKSELSLQEDPDGTALVDMWIDIGATSIDNIPIDWSKEDLGI
jgi:hypothetical protein